MFLDEMLDMFLDEIDVKDVLDEIDVKDVLDEIDVRYVSR